MRDWMFQQDFKFEYAAIARRDVHRICDWCWGALERGRQEPL
jgi:hypothetical protein